MNCLKIEKEPITALSLVLSFSYSAFTALLIHYLAKPSYFSAKEPQNRNPPIPNVKKYTQVDVVKRSKSITGMGYCRNSST